MLMYIAHSHCPWVNNCVALQNHRYFVLYIFFLFLGLVLFTNLTLTYVPLAPAPTDVSLIQCSFLNPELCAQWCKDPFTIVIAGWGAIQLTWTTMLLFVQLSQIARAMTTYESMKGHHTGTITTALTTGSTSAEGGAVTGPSTSPSDRVHTHGRKHNQKEGCLAQWKKLLGLDTFVATALHGSRAGEVMARRKHNPYNRGFVRNCRDFWCDAGGGTKILFGKKADGVGLLGGQVVDYRRLYEVPSTAGMRYAVPTPGDGEAGEGLIGGEEV